MAKGDWATALKTAGTCIAAERAAAPAPPANWGNWSILSVLNVHIWQLNQAVLSAKLGQHADTDRAIADARSWADLYGLAAANWLVPVVPMMELTQAYAAERRGEQAMAVQH